MARDWSRLLAPRSIAILGATDRGDIPSLPQRFLRAHAYGGAIYPVMNLNSGEQFELHAAVLRLGSRVGSTRMEFLGPDGKLFATGAGATCSDRSSTW